MEASSPRATYRLLTPSFYPAEAKSFAIFKLEQDLFQRSLSLLCVLRSPRYFTTVQGKVLGIVRVWVTTCCLFPLQAFVALLLKVLLFLFGNGVLFLLLRVLTLFCQRIVLFQSMNDFILAARGADAALTARLLFRFLESVLFS